MGYTKCGMGKQKLNKSRNVRKWINTVSQRINTVSQSVSALSTISLTQSFFYLMSVGRRSDFLLAALLQSPRFWRYPTALLGIASTCSIMSNAMSIILQISLSKGKFMSKAHGRSGRSDMDSLPSFMNGIITLLTVEDGFPRFSKTLDYVLLPNHLQICLIEIQAVQRFLFYMAQLKSQI